MAATAPDSEDGTADGVSELGALYCLALVPDGGSACTVQELFHTSFAGGSGSSPALSADGARVYVGDNIGNLIAVDGTDGSKIWALNVGAMIYGSVGVASDGNVLCVSNADAVIRVKDNRPSGRVGRAPRPAFVPRGRRPRQGERTGPVAPPGDAL